MAVDLLQVEALRITLVGADLCVSQCLSQRVTARVPDGVEIECVATMVRPARGDGIAPVEAFVVPGCDLFSLRDVFLDLFQLDGKQCGLD